MTSPEPSNSRRFDGSNRSSPALIFLHHWHQSSEFARALAEAITNQVSGVRVFMESHHLAVGQTWRAPAEHAAEACDILLVLIGPSLLTDKRRHQISWGDSGQKYIQIAMRAEKPIIPVLHDGVSSSDLSDLPLGLQQLSWYKSMEIRNATLDEDIGKLREGIERILNSRDGT